MTNTYVLNVTRNQEFQVENELDALGLNPWVPKRLAWRRVKERKDTIWYDAAYIPKLVFCVFPAVSWPDVVGIKHVIGKPMQLTALDINGVPAKNIARLDGTVKHVPAISGLSQFKQAVEAEYADMDRKRENAEYVCAYEVGQALEVLNGPFAGTEGPFKKIVTDAKTGLRRVRLEVDLLGRATSVDLEPQEVGVV